MDDINMNDELVERQAAYNLHFLPLPGRANDRETQMARLQDYMIADRDEDAAKRVRDYYGEGVPVGAVSEKAMQYFVGAAMARNLGISGAPEAYWLGREKPEALPEVERQDDLYTEMGRDIITKTQDAWVEQQVKLQERRQTLGTVLQQIVQEGEANKKESAAWLGFLDAQGRGVWSEDEAVSLVKATEAFSMMRGLMDDPQSAGANVLTKGSTGQLIFDALYGDEMATGLFFSALQDRIADMKTAEEERNALVQFAHAFEAATKNLTAGMMGGHFRAFVTDEQVDEYNAVWEKARKATGVENPNVERFAEGDNWFEKMLPVGNARLAGVRIAANKSGQKNADGSLRKMTDEERRSTQELNEFRGQLHNAVQGVYDIDGLAKFGKMMPGSLAYLVPGGMLASAMSMRTHDLASQLGEGLDWVSANARATVNAAIQAGVEKMAFGSIKATKMAPGLDALMSTGPMARVFGKLYGTTAGRIGMGVVAGGLEETFAEPAAGLLLSGIYNAFAPTGLELDSPWVAYKNEMAEMLEPDQILATALYGLLLGGVNVPGHRAEAEHYKKVVEGLERIGIDHKVAANMARSDGSLQQIAAGVQQVDAALKKDAGSVFGYIAELYPQLQEISTFENLMRAYNLPKMLPGEGGNVRVQYKDEDGKVQELVMSQEAGRLFVQARIEQLGSKVQVGFADMVLGQVMTGKVAEKSDSWVVSVEDADMNADYFRRIAAAAGIRLSQGAKVTDIAPEIHPYIPLGTLAQQGRAWESRMRVARGEAEEKLGRKLTDEEWAQREKQLVSRVNRVRVASQDGRVRTVLRVARGGYGAMEVLEDVTEDFLSLDMEENGRELGWYADNLLELERALGRQGAFLHALKEGESYDRMAIIEGVGKLVQSKVLADTTRKYKLGEKLNAFLDMIRHLVQRAVAMLMLGKAINKVLADKEASAKLDPEFVGMVDRLVEKDVEFLRELQLEDGLAAMQRVLEQRVPSTPVLAEAEAKHGEQVREEMAAKAAAQAKVDADVAEGEAAVEGSMSADTASRYHVVDDSVELEKRLDDVVDVVEISFVEEEGKNWLKEAKQYFSLIAGRVFSLENTEGFTLKMPDHRAGRDTAVKGIRKKHQFKAEVIKKFEELFKKVVLLDRQIPAHKDKETPSRKKRVAAAKVFYKFGWPVRINGTEKMFWFGADAYDATNEKNVVFYEFGLQGMNEKGDSAVRTVLPDEEVEQGTESPLSAITLGDYLANVKLNPNQERVLPEVVSVAETKEDSSLSVAEAEETGRYDGNVTQEMDAIKAAAEKDGTFMKAPNGEPTNLTEQQWLQVRTAAFKRWFGDWESLAYQQHFRKRLLGLLTPDIVQKMSGKDYESIKKSDLDRRVLPMAYIPLKIARLMGDYVTDNLIYTSDFRFVEHVVNHHSEIKDYAKYVDTLLNAFSNPDKVYHDTKTNAFLFLKDEQAYFLSVANPPGEGQRYIQWKTAYHSHKLNGSRYKEIWSKNDRESVGTDLHDKGPTHEESPSARLSDLDSKGNIKEVVRDVKPENVSKIVDANGEPLVVYHGTVHGGFRVFDVDGRGKTEGAGAFFTSDKRVAEGYSANFHTGGVTPEVYACFLNIRKPHEVDFAGNSWNRVPDRASGYFVHYDNGESEWFSNRADADFAVSGYEGKAEIEEDWEDSPTLDDLAREVWEEEPGVDGIIAGNVVDTAVGASKAYPATDFIVASPNQIKSATDNRGTFDGSEADITLSVVGESAANWDKIKHRAFKGRDEGKLRVEIDASQAKIKNLGVSDEYAEQEAGMLLRKVDKFVEGLSAEKRELLEKYIEVYNSDFSDEEREAAIKEERRLEEANKETLDSLHAELGGMVERMWIEAILPGVDYREVEMRTQVREYYEKNIKLDERRYLGDVLDFEALYEAYPKLRYTPVSFRRLGTGTNAQVERRNGKDHIVIHEGLLRYPEGEMLRTLLHEVQHVIQGIEGFAQGGNEDYANELALMRESVEPEKYGWVLNKSPYELYRRLAGEVEARNVQKRVGYSAVEREMLPFNSTMDIPEHETLVSFSVFSPSEASGLRALQSAVCGKQDAVFRSDTLNADVMLPFGSAGVYKNPDNPKSKIVGAHGLLHIITARMAHGDSLEEATYTAVKAVLAAVNGRIVGDSSSENKKELTLDGYNTWVYLKWRAENKAWVVTGYKENDKHSSVDDRQRAMNLAESYALNTFGGLERVGAALEYSIARVAREYKQNNANPFLKLDFSSSMVDLSEEGIAHKVVAAGAGMKANEAFVDKMLAEIRGSILRMKKLGSKTRTEREDALVAMGGITHMVRALVQYLPRGYRFAVHPYMNKLEVLTELATTGNVEMLRENVSKGLQAWMDETSENWHEVLPQLSGNENMTREELTARVKEMMKEHAGQQLTEAVERIVERVAGQLRKHAKDTAVKRIHELLERVMPKKDPKSGKLKGGKMSADAYRDLQMVAEALGLKSDKLEEKLAGLRAKLESAELSEAERDAIEGELMVYDQFGDLESMSAKEAVAALEALRQRIWMERFEWENIMAERRAARRAVVRKVVDGVGSISENEYNAKKRRMKPTKRLKYLGDILSGMPAALAGLRGYLPLRELAAGLEARANRAGELIKQWEAERWEALEALSKETMGRSWRLCMDFMHEVLPTGVSFDRPKYRTVDIKVAALRELLAMDAKERKAEMKRRREAGGKEAETALSERDIEAAARELERMDEAGEVKGWVHAKYLAEVQHEENLRLSRGEALYAILMYEQPTYTERMEAQGYTPEVIAGFREFVGEGLLRFGYGLRELFARQGDRIAVIYEREFGVPFPREENYFAARWVVNGMKENPAEQLLAGMAGTPGAGNGWMKQRVDHNLELDMTKDALQVFLQATTLTDTWMATQDIVADFKAWTRDKDFERALTTLLGKEGYDNIKDWVRILELGGVQDCLNMGVTQDVINGLYGSGAVAILGLRVQTLIRQLPSVFNGLLGAPDISAAEWMLTLARMKHGEAPMTYEKMKKSVLLKSRQQGRAGNMASQAMRANDSESSVTEEFLLASMLPMEWVDASCTAMSLVPVWNIYYQRAVEKGASHAEAERAAWEQTTIVANLASQPIGILNRSKVTQNRSSIVKAAFFMLSESTAKFAMCRALWKGRNKMAAVRAWLVYGAANAAISALLDYLQGDPDEWEKGEWWEYMLSAAYGPLASIPGMGELVEELGTLVFFTLPGHVFDIEKLKKAKTSASVGRALIDVQGFVRAWRKIYGFLTDDEEHSLAEYTRAASTISRTTAIATGWMGNMVGFWSTAVTVLMNPIDFGARVYRNMKNYAEK